MNYLLLTVLGATMFSNQQHQIVGDMIDMNTGEVIPVSYTHLTLPTILLV